MGKFTETDWVVSSASWVSMTHQEFAESLKHWLETAKYPRFKRLYADPVYQPMLGVMNYLRANGFGTYLVDGEGKEFVRAYGIPPEQVTGSSLATRYEWQGASRNCCAGQTVL